ncbi:glycosyltransferase family 1 protein [Stipitochalara longipes BDJ]|nr:glycosyltransferase family 1 protein [Stipitochalara longipes BDJ]
MNKVCLITTGATAAFPELVQAALRPDCLQTLADNGFTKLIFQCGDTFNLFNNMIPVDLKGLDVEAFDFKAAGLNQEMRECQARDGVSKKGLLICHAGAGTILDGMRLGLSLIVVPNESLLDNHQGELAEELEAQGYATHSSTKGLAKAIEIACKKEDKVWVGQNASLAPIVDAVVGYEDDIRARLD